MARSKYSGEVTSNDGDVLDLKPADMRTIHNLMLAVDEAATAAREASRKHNELKDELLAVLDAQEIKTAKVSDGDSTGQATTVRGSTSFYDEARLKKRLGASMWNKITTRVLDENKLGAYVKSGDIDTAAVAESITEKPRKPYVRVTF